MMGSTSASPGATGAAGAMGTVGTVGTTGTTGPTGPVPGATDTEDQLELTDSMMGAVPTGGISADGTAT